MATPTVALAQVQPGVSVPRLSWRQHDTSPFVVLTDLRMNLPLKFFEARRTLRTLCSLLVFEAGTTL